MTEKSTPLRNARHEQFCHEYLKDFNATAAYQRVYPRSGEAAARRSASELLTNPDVARRLEVLRAALADQTGVETERIIGELKTLGFSDIRRLVDAQGRLLPVQQWPDEAAACVASIEVVTKTIPGSNPVEVVYVHKIRMWDKPVALKLLGQYRKLFTDRCEHTFSQTLEELVAGSLTPKESGTPQRHLSDSHHEQPAISSRFNGAADHQSAALPPASRPVPRPAMLKQPAALDPIEQVYGRGMSKNFRPASAELSPTGRVISNYDPFTEDRN
jgi:phage terminase small subunit